MASFRSGATWRGVVGVALACALLLVAIVAGASRAAREPRVRVDVLEDRTRASTYADVTSEDTRGRFVALDPARTNVGYSASAFWLRVAIETDADEPTSWILEPSRSPDRAELYPEAGGSPRRSGALLPPADRDVRARMVAFRVDLPPHAKQTFHLRIESTDTIGLAVQLSDAESFGERERHENLLGGGYYGLVLGIILYNLFLFVSTRDRSYLLYVVFQSSLVLVQASLDRFGFEYLWSRSAWFAQRSDEVLGSIAIFAAVRFAATYLETRARWPKFDRALQVLAVGALAFAVAALVYDNDVVKLGIAVWFLATVVLLLAAGAVAVRHGVPNAPYFLAAWALFLLGALVHVMSAVGVLQTAGPISLAWLKAGSAAEATLLSLGLGNRLRLLRGAERRAQAALLDERAEHTRSLEARVDERTRELSAALAELRAAQDLLVRQERLATLGRLAAGVGHEVGNPLNFVIGGATELETHLAAIESSPDRSVALVEARRALRLVTSGSDRIKKVVANLRRYVASDDVPPEPTDLVAELGATLDLTADLCAKCGVTVVRSFEPLPLISVRAGEIGQVFMNIVLNACTAMQSGGTLSIATKADDASVEIRFADDGPGMPASIRGAIFDAFARSNGGSGLGLFVSREIAVRHGGDLRYVHGVGATFVLTLPREPAAS